MIINCINDCILDCINDCILDCIGCNEIIMDFNE